MFSSRTSRSLAPLLALAALGCTTAADVGELCTDSNDCLASLACIRDPGAETAVCLERCEPALWLCEGGEVCYGDPVAVCHPGGATALGASCTLNQECVRGAVCVVFATGGPGQCLRACRTADSTPCPMGETCTLLLGATHGYCQPDTE